MPFSGTLTSLARLEKKEYVMPQLSGSRRCGRSDRGHAPAAVIYAGIFTGFGSRPALARIKYTTKPARQLYSGAGSVYGATSAETRRGRMPIRNPTAHAPYPAILMPSL